MKFPLSSFVLAVIFLLQTMIGAGAATWLEQISGDAKAVVIARQGNFLEAEEMMRLRPGDVIKLLDDKVSLRLLLGSGKIETLTKARSPFTVAGKGAGSSFLSNLMGEVRQMLVASADQTEAVAMMTRGRSKQLKVLAAGAEENLFLAGTGDLTAVWQGGAAPYTVSVLGDESDIPLLQQKGLAQHQVSLQVGKRASGGLPEGEYQLVVEATGGGSTGSSELSLLVVGRDELPDRAQKLLSLGLDKRVEARLLINLLYKLPEWRFYAHGLAVRYGLQKEQALLAAAK